MAHIKKAIASVESGNPVNYAIGKVDMVIITVVVVVYFLLFIYFLR